jgi:ABC-2 type transport system permease protein
LGQENPDTTSFALSHSGFRYWFAVAIIVSLVTGAVGTIVPLRIGIKAFQRMEF